MSEPRRCPQCDAEIPANSPIGLCPRCLLKSGTDSQSAAASVEPGPTKLTPPASGFVPPTVEELAPLFPQMEILELLGKGGMGAVYKARQPGLDRLVAVKILPPEISRDPAFAERFQREARALAKLSHPHIVAVYDFGVVGQAFQPDASVPPGQARKPDLQGGLCYIVMEFVDGANLRQTIRTGTLTSAEALAIVPQICEALQFAHDEGIVHRDIKPENILIDKRGRVKIADFGLAKLLGQDASDHSLTATHQVMGTLRYMAPEQMQGSREVDHRADIYSLGVVFYELLTGELPMGKFAPPSKKVQVDVRLDEIVLRALEQEPEQRYQHASEVKTDVESLARPPHPLAPTPAVAVDVNSQTATTQEIPSARLLRFLEGSWAWRWFLAIATPMVLVVSAWANRPTSLGETPSVSAAANGGFILAVAGFALLLWIMGRTSLSWGTTRWRKMLHIAAGLTLLILSLPPVEKLPLVEAVIAYRQNVTFSAPRDVKVRIQTPAGQNPLVPEGVSADWWFGGVPGRLVRLTDGLATLDTDQPLPQAAYGDLSVIVVLAPDRLVYFHPDFPSRLSSSGVYQTQGGFSIWKETTTQSLRPTQYDRRAAEQVSLALFFLTLIFMHRTWMPMRRMLGLSETTVAVVVPRASPVAAADLEPRLSRCALVGAIWAGLGLPAAVILPLAIATTPKGTTLGGILHIPVPLFALFAISAPIGATILGAVAIAKIKRSDGKLYGLRLAQADALLFPLLLLAGVAGFVAMLIVLTAIRWGIDPLVFDKNDLPHLWIVVMAVPIWFFPARSLWRAVVGPRDAFELENLPLVGNESLMGNAALVIALAAITAHAWPWHWIISPTPNPRSMTISNFDVIDALQSFWLLVLSIGATLFASAATLARPAKTILRIGSVLAALVALVIQVQFFRSLGEFQPGHIEKVVRLTRTYSHMGVYVTMALTGLGILFFVLRLFEEMMASADPLAPLASGRPADGTVPMTRTPKDAL
jgi:predicted Ser/Thr protein kinase